MARKTYPMTRTQEETALRRGWTHSRASKRWRAPDDFTDADRRRIDPAADKRRRRQRGTD